ncbi:sigma-70 family RNA polymerase sigma factor [Bacillus licheniformis]|uniref:RNA polymerase sigma factor n=1 Tax=Bacillus licheniformis TaxID=1402 RepID=UPI0020C88773|nr:sigma factor [Bacillus licheniformis]MCP8973111.1 sigma-70 family RNA polymerase sigma factor [Bacillus licheniformis]
MTAATINANNITMELLTTTSMNKIFNFELFKVKLQDKEDVKQDCIIRILSALKKQEVPVEKLPAFCQTIIKRTVVDYYRKTNRKIDQNSTTVFFCDGYEDGHEQSAGECFLAESDDYGFEVTEIRTDFENNRTRFTPTEQAAIEFMLSNYTSMSMSLAEIAEELKIHKSHTTRAFQKLRQLYRS